MLITKEKFLYFFLQSKLFTTTYYNTKTQYNNRKILLDMFNKNLTIFMDSSHKLPIILLGFSISNRTSQLHE